MAALGAAFSAAAALAVPFLTEVFLTAFLGASGVQVKMLTLMGATLMTMESGRSFHSSFLEVFTLGLVQPLPPNSSLSLFKISLYLPAKGTPSWNFSWSTGAKLQTKSRVSSFFFVFLTKITMFSAALLHSIHWKPSG